MNARAKVSLWRFSIRSKFRVFRTRSFCVWLTTKSANTLAKRSSTRWSSRICLKERAKVVEMDASFMTRSVNEGFSGGEKKRNEILQMAVLEPKLAVLDETDSGLDIDALRIVAGGVNQLHTPENAIILVTHYQRLLNYIVPDYVHVLANGRIAREGGKELALELEKKVTTG